ncbi:MAG: hypothetical protein QOK17_457 [Sphingomonadales bacterium]|jgi:YD repeat-containing protein|nr:hypothetical protein [Sphingomonadales bacterium]
MQVGNGGARLLLVVLISAIATAAGAAETTTFSYDALGRLVSSTNSGRVNSGLATTIAYDPAGNRQSYNVATGGGGTPVIVDGSFEQPPQNGGYAYGPTVTGVTFSGGAGVQGNGSAWGFANAPDGSQTGFLQTGSVGGSIAFAVSGLTPGASYQARFSIAQRTNWGGVATVTVSFNGTPIGSFTPASSAFAQVMTASFTAGPATGTLTFSVPAGTGDNSAAIDAVSLVAGPAVPDSSFETPAQNGSFTYNPTVAGVTFSGRAGVQGNGSAWGFLSAPDGIQTGVLQSYGGEGGSISFTVSGLTPGMVYRASFYVSQRPNYGGAATVSVSFNGNSAGSFTPASTAFALVTSASFTASAATGALTFSVPNGSADASAAIDVVSVAAGP